MIIFHYYVYTAILNKKNVRVLFRLQDLEQGVLPQVKEIVVTPSITNNDMQRAVSSLVKLDDIKKDKKAKKHKKSKS